MTNLRGSPFYVNLGEPLPPRVISRDERARRVNYYTDKRQALRRRALEAEKSGNSEKAAQLAERVERCEKKILELWSRE